MSAARPSEGEVAEARELLRGLSSARQTYGLYPDGHPRRVEAARTVLFHARRLREALGHDPVVFASRQRFYLGRTLLAWESLTLHRLAEAFDAAGIQSVELLPAVSEEDADALTRALLGEREALAFLAGVAVNRAGPRVLAEEEEGLGLAELLHSYAAGLELLRETAARLLAGQPADMDATRRLTERLADQIASDPAQALLLTTVKSYDEYTYHHMVNVCILSLALGQGIGLQRDQVITLGMGGLLHDVGKVKVPQEILQHDGALNEEQWRLIQRHPVDGAGLILMTSRNLYHPSVSIVLEHHAAYDRSGYPSLSGRRQPSLPSRIVAVADCFDAVTSKRPYRRAEERRQALNLLQAGAGRGFDPRVVRTFVRMMGIFPVGSLVQLSTGDIGVVMRNDERLLARPAIRLMLDARGEPCDPRELDLAERAEGGGFRWDVLRSVDPQEVGVDMLYLLASGKLEGVMQPEVGPGLIHEPAPGEEPPAGYVDAHEEDLHRVDDVEIDRDVAPPFPE